MSPTLRRYFQEIFLDMKVMFCKWLVSNLEHACNDFFWYRSTSFHVICSDSHENKKLRFCQFFFIGARERKYLQQPQASSLRFHYPLLFLIVSSDFLSHVAGMAIDHLQRWALTVSWTSLRSTSTLAPTQLHSMGSSPDGGGSMVAAHCHPFDKATASSEELPEWIYSWGWGSVLLRDHAGWMELMAGRQQLLF